MSGRRRQGGGGGGGPGGHSISPPIEANSLIALTDKAFFGFTPEALDLFTWWDMDTYDGTILPDKVGSLDLLNTGTNRPGTTEVNGHTVATFDGSQALICADRTAFRWLHAGVGTKTVCWFMRADAGQTSQGIWGTAGGSCGARLINSTSSDARGQRFYANGFGLTICRIPHMTIESGTLPQAPNQAWVAKVQPSLFDQADYDNGGPGFLFATGRADSTPWLISGFSGNDTNNGPNEDADPEGYFCLGGAGAPAPTGPPGGGIAGFVGQSGDYIIVNGEVTDSEAAALLWWYHNRYRTSELGWMVH